MLAPIRLTNAAAQLPCGSGETQGEASPLRSTPPPPLRGLPNGSQIGSTYTRPHLTCILADESLCCCFAPASWIGFPPHCSSILLSIRAPPSPPRGAGVGFFMRAHGKGQVEGHGGRPLALIRLANAGSCPSRQRDCVATASPSAETKGTAQLVLRTQARRKEQGPPFPTPPPSPTCWINPHSTTDDDASQKTCLCKTLLANERTTRMCTCQGNRYQGGGKPPKRSLKLPPRVTLSPCASLRVNSAKGLARAADRCFAALSMTRLSLPCRLG